MMQVVSAPQFNTVAVIIDGPASLEEVIEFAEEVGAIWRDGDTDEGEVDFVIDFRVDDRRVGPEIYTKSALRGSLDTIAGRFA
jgi:hypothetical protein